MERNAGFTVVEMLVVVAVIAISAALYVAVGSGRERHVEAAADLARRVAAVRWLAVVTGRGDACLPNDLHGRAYDGVRVTWPARGLAFNPDGLARACDGGGVGNATIVVEHGGRTAAVIVSTLGRVRWERR